MPKSTGENWMGTTEAAQYLGVILRTLYKLIDAGEIRAYKVGRLIRLRREDVDAYIDAQQIRPGELKHLYPRGQEGGE